MRRIVRTVPASTSAAFCRCRSLMDGSLRVASCRLGQSGAVTWPPYYLWSAWKLFEAGSLSFELVPTRLPRKGKVHCARNSKPNMKMFGFVFCGAKKKNQLVRCTNSLCPLAAPRWCSSRRGRRLVCHARWPLRFRRKTTRSHVFSLQESKWGWFDENQPLCLGFFCQKGKKNARTSVRAKSTKEK